MVAVQEHFAPQVTTVKAIDGLSLEFPLWRLNLRASNTEPLLRLNVESRGDALLLQEMTSQVLAIVDRFID
jgi:phosphomannomutase